MDRLDSKGNPIPFHIRFLTADRGKDSGGKWISTPGCILSKNNPALPLIVRRVDGYASSRKQKHYENATRNIQFQDSTIKTVRIRLIKEFNHNLIIW